MPSTCAACGSVVSARFARVFGTNDDDVEACLECTTWAAIQRHGATRKAREWGDARGPE